VLVRWPRRTHPITMTESTFVLKRVMKMPHPNQDYPERPSPKAHPLVHVRSNRMHQGEGIHVLIVYSKHDAESFYRSLDPVLLLYKGTVFPRLESNSKARVSRTLGKFVVDTP
jgi:hypothetical protein